MSTQVAQRPGFRATIETMARGMLAGMIPAADLQVATASTATSFAAARSQARDPASFDACLETEAGRASIGRCIVQAALTRVYPGGVAPLAYLVPQRARKEAPWELRYNLSHRGACLLASEEGWAVLPVAVHVEDALEVQFGEVAEHRPCGKEPVEPQDLAGVYVTLRRDGRLISRPWVSADAIEARRQRSRAKDVGPWATDPIPMAQKTAIHYCVARGILPLRSASARDAMGEDVIDTTATEVAERPTIARPRPVAALPAPVEEIPAARERETITVQAQTVDEEAP